MGIQSFVWQKFYPGQFVQLILGHPNHIVGMWIKVWCKLSTSKCVWTTSETIAGWSRIIGESERDTKHFINYVKDNFNGVKITSTVHGASKNTITITDEWYKNLQKVRDRATARTRKSRGTRKPELTHARGLMFSEVMAKYHHSKITTMPLATKKEFIEVAKESSKKERGTKKRLAAEREEVNKILDYIKYLKGTDKWMKEDGRYLPNIHDLIASRVWRYHSRAEETDTAKKGREAAKEKILNII